MNNTTLETRPTVNACLWCGKDKGTRAKYCSRACGQKYGYRASRATAPQCNEPGCSKPVQARGMCGSHYGQWHRTEGGKERTYTCTGCGIEYTTKRKPQGSGRFCSTPCQQLWLRTDEEVKAKQEEGRQAYLKTIPPTYRRCTNCREEFLATGTSAVCCSEKCAEARHRKLALDSRSPLRKAYEENNRKGILEAIEERVSVTKSGCWEWPYLDTNGYPRAVIGDKRIAVHRLSLEAKYGAPLGSQAAHHVCANTRCVNPEHLQPVTHRDNTAEMMARRAYVDRIAELEEVIKELAPDHEVLNRVPIK